MYIPYGIKQNWNNKSGSAVCVYQVIRIKLSNKFSGISLYLLAYATITR